MTPKFLRSEAARFREMADSVTDREASKQRLLNMASDYESRANAAGDVQLPEPIPDPDPVTESEPATDAPATDAGVVKTRAGRKNTLRL
jgi:hypothetical protein